MNLNCKIKVSLNYMKINISCYILYNREIMFIRTNYCRLYSIIVYVTIGYIQDLLNKYVCLVLIKKLNSDILNSNYQL